MAKIAFAAGVVWWIIDIIRYIDQFDFSDLFDFDDGNLCIGIWIALILYIVMLIIPRKQKKTINQ